MKKLSYTLLTVVMLLSVTSLFAQGKYGADSANCVKYLNFYRDYYRQNNYQDAAGLWRKAMESCPPTASQNMLIHGRQIMTYLINTYQGAPEGKQALVDSLLMISDIRAQYYPSRKLVASDSHRGRLSVPKDCQSPDPEGAWCTCGGNSTTPSSQHAIATAMTAGRVKRPVVKRFWKLRVLIGGVARRVYRSKPMSRRKYFPSNCTNSAAR